MEEVFNDETKTVEVGGVTFPLITLKSQGKVMNRLHGHSGDLSPNFMRESITPINQEKKITVQLQEFDIEAQKVKYEIWDSTGDHKLDEGSISSFQEGDKGREVTFTFDGEFNPSKEYNLKITIITKLSRKIHYFTRLKYYVDETYLTDKLDFVKTFHNATINKDENYLTNYVESNGEMDETTYAKVTIHSSLSQVMWGELNPDLVTKIVPTIKEFNVETASIQYKYYATIETSSGMERYLVQEYYRVRYTSSRIYLLNFERTMEADFNVDLTSISQNQFKFGVTQEIEDEVIYNDTGDQVAFVRNSELFYYDAKKNTLKTVYNFYPEDTNLLYQLYQEQSIKIVKMDDKGDLYFAIYGYMTRGAYEGKIAIVLYKFNTIENTIEELVYIPLETTYQMLKEELEEFMYMNSGGLFYFSLGGNIYSYNVIARSLQIIAEQIPTTDYQVLALSQTLAWMERDERGTAEQIKLLNMETGAQQYITAREGNRLKLLGSLNSNLIYGIVKEKDITYENNGKVLVPMYQLMIIDGDNNVRKEYRKKNYYISDIRMEDSVIRLERRKKDGKTFVLSDEDSIINQTQEERHTIRYVSRVTDDMMIEWYLQIPVRYQMEEIPTQKDSKTSVISTETSLHLPKSTLRDELFFVYAYGDITQSTTDIAQAVMAADEQMGVVIDKDNNLLWERGGKFLSYTIGGIDQTKSSATISSIQACVYMLLKNNHVAITLNEIGRAHV